MKRFTMILVALVLAFGCYAQQLTHTLANLKVRQTYVTDVTGAMDTLTTNQDTIDFIFTLNKEYPVQWYIFNDVDSVDAPTVAFTLWGRILPQDDWSLIETVNYTGSADTTFAFSSVTSSTATLLMDTTAVFPGSLNSTTNDSTFMLYTGTLVTPTVASYYRQLRLRAISSSGSSLWEKLILKLWDRKF